MEILAIKYEKGWKEIQEKEDALKEERLKFKHLKTQEDLERANTMHDKIDPLG